MAGTKKGIAAGIIISLTLILLIVLGFFSFTFLRDLKKDSLFNDYLTRADDALDAGDYSKTFALLKQALTLRLSKVQYLRILKRGFVLAKKSDDSSLLVELARPLIERKIRDKDLLFIIGYVFLRAGERENFDTLFRNISSHDNIGSLKVESLLSEGKADECIEFYKPISPFRFLNLINSSDPVLYSDAGLLLEDNRLILDSSLLYAAKGNFQKAFTIMSPFMEDKIFQTPKIYIAYDSGHFEEAQNFIEENVSLVHKSAEICAVGGDISLYYHDYARALEYYLKALALRPSLSPSVYVNISYIYLMNEDMQKGLEWLKKGFTIFPRERSIVLEAAKFFLSIGKNQTAHDIISSYASTQGQDPAITLLLYFQEQEKMNPTQYRTGLWDIFNKNPKNELICRFLVVSLMGIEDVKGAEAALTLFDKSRNIKNPDQENIAWVFHYKGICKALSGSVTEGIDLFSQSLDLEYNPVVMFHRALLNIDLKNYRLAGNDLRSIIQTGNTSVAENAHFLSRVNARLGKVYMRTGEFTRAWEQFTKALEIDKGNYEVHTLMEELEELQQ
ncbi:MAG: hypothetical protein JXJ04_05375 [Spirochaetales bacterium]|nr:hypothetical protein [Spirochaetales bacterium]